MKINPDILFRNFDIFQKSVEEAKSLKSLAFQLALSGRLDFQKLSNGQIKKPLPSLIKEQIAYLQKEGILFSMSSNISQNLMKLQKEGQTTKKRSHLIDKNLKKSLSAFIKEQNLHLQKENNALSETSDSIWPIVALGEVCKIFSGSRPKGGAIKSGILSIGGEHINFDGSFNLTKPKYVPKKYFHQLKRGKLENKDVLLVKDGATTGKMGYFDEKSPFNIGAVNEHVFILRSAFKRINPFYLYQFLRSKEGNAKILNFKTGSAQGGINLSIKNLLISLPPLPVQKEIASLMKECTLLEAQTKEKSQKQEEFSKSSMYFIPHSKNRLEFTHNWKRLRDNFNDILYSENGVKNFKSLAFQLALSGRLNFQKLSNGQIKKPLPFLIKEQIAYLQKEGIPFSISSNISQNLIKLQEGQTTNKKSYLIEKNLKKSLSAFIKEKNLYLQKENNILSETSDSIWPIVALGDICQIFSGSRPKGGAVKSGVLSIGGEHINSNGSFNLTKSKYIPKKYFHQLKRGKLENKDVLLVKDGATTGKMGYFDEKSPFKIGAVNEHVFILRSAFKRINPFYLYQFLRSKEGNAKILNFKTGSAQGGINLSIKNLLIPLPPLRVQKEITSLMEVIENIEHQIHKEKTLSVQLSQSLSYANPF